MIYYKKKNIDQLLKFIKRDINILDIGSRGGQYGWLNDISKKANFIKFDADPNIAEKNFSGLFDRECQKDFYLCKDNSQSSFFKPNDEIINYEGENIRLDYKIIKDLKLTNIDKIFKNDQKKIDIIKIDTQGSEFEILMGAKNLLEKNKPLLFLETWSYPIYKDIKLFSDIILEMKKMKYELWGMDDAAAFRMNVSDLFKTNFARRRIAGYNLFLCPIFQELKKFDFDTKEIYSLILFIHGYTDWSSILIKNHNSKLKDEMFKIVKKENKFAKFNYLKFIIKDFINKALGKGPQKRYDKFT